MVHTRDKNLATPYGMLNFTCYFIEAFKCNKNLEDVWASFSRVERDSIIEHRGHCLQQCPKKRNVCASNVSQFELSWHVYWMHSCKFFLLLIDEVLPLLVRNVSHALLKLHTLHLQTTYSLCKLHVSTSSVSLGFCHTILHALGRLLPLDDTHLQAMMWLCRRIPACHSDGLGSILTSNPKFWLFI